MIIAGFVKEDSETDCYYPCILINERLIYGWKDGLIRTEVLDSKPKLIWRFLVACNSDVKGFKEAEKWLKEKIEKLLSEEKMKKNEDNTFSFLILDDIRTEEFIVSGV